MGFSNFGRSVKLRTLDLEPSDAFVFVLGNAVSAQAGGAILAVEFLAVENFVPAFTAFDSSIDELKHPEFPFLGFDPHQRNKGAIPA